ncbi:MAG: ABC transporter permease [Phycisphaerales bacterium]|nr:ABC transporter permease [Phycisphaerales bacterium]
MGTYIARRLLLMIPTLIGITFLVFMLVALSPGGVGAALMVSGGGQMEAQSRAIQQAYLEDRYGLNDPAVVQYVRWLGRISPIKFGVRDQVAPDGERFRPPKDVEPPPAWSLFDAQPPPPPPSVPPVTGTQEERQRAYRRASNDYAGSRGRLIEARLRLERTLVEFARGSGRKDLVTRDGKLVPGAFEHEKPTMTQEQWAQVGPAGEAAVAAYKQAIIDRARLAKAFESRPFEEAGVPIIPGVLSLAAPDFGRSFTRSRPVLDLIMDHLPVTITLNLIAFPIIYMIAIPSGMLAATRRGSMFDAVSGTVFIALYSVPVVLAGVLAIGYLASNQYLGWFPAAGLHDTLAERMTFLPSTGPDGVWVRGYLLDGIWHMVLPVTCLVYAGFAVLSKQTRAAMLDNFNADYVRTAKAKGVPARDIVLRHVFRNSLLPLITIFTTIFPAMLAGSVVVERIFTVPGMGSLLLDAISLRDREVILANTLMIGVVNLLALLMADILYALADPRVSYE